MKSAIPFLELLQSSITPIALISGVGLLLISLTNRLGRTIDAIRKISKEVDLLKGAEKQKKIAQLKIIFRRSKLLRNGISLMAFSILNSSLIVFVILIMTLTGYDLHNLAIVLLFLSISGIIGAAFFLFFDVILTLNAVKYEIQEQIK
ncbi:MAG: DUF2721 domain-containing protein [Fidelibacterota bacterium]